MVVATREWVEEKIRELKAGDGIAISESYPSTEADRAKQISLYEALLEQLKGSDATGSSL